MPRDRSLPVFELEPPLLEALSSTAPRLVVEAPTGSGKSTQIPQFLADSPVCAGQEVWVLQPRRLAARMLAARVAAERGSALGGEVGYQVRFESALSAQTRIRFVTEGILVRQFLERPDLKGIAAVVIDEFHERNFFADVSLARCLDVQRAERPDLKIVVMSATLESRSLLEYLGDGARLLRSEGRTYPVEVEWKPPRDRQKGELWDHVVRVLRECLGARGVEGHVLVFMPGRYEIQKTAQALAKAPWAKAFEIHELYGELPPDKQDAAVAPGGRPRIVVATNVAETSITIDGVRVVVDSGLERRASFDHRRGITTLHIHKISHASADQRAGRAGRTGPGTAIRLWSQRDHEQRSPATPPEIQRMDLAEALLALAASGVEDLRRFNWLEPPDAMGLDAAMRGLISLGALDREERLTSLGRKISSLPISPRYGRFLVEAWTRGCLEEAALVAALAHARPLFPAKKRSANQLTPEDFAQPDDLSDFEPLMRAWHQAEANLFNREICERLGIHGGAARDVDRIARQLLRIAGRWRDSPQSLPGSPHSAGSRSADAGEASRQEALARSLLAGFSDQVAIRSSSTTLSCSVAGGRRGQIGKSSVAAANEAALFLASEIVEVEGRELGVKLGLCTRIEEQWLLDLCPEEFHQTSGAVWDERTRRVVGRREKRFRDLVLESKPGDDVPLDQSSAILAEKVAAGELVLRSWDAKVDAWIARLNLAADACPEYGLAKIDDEARLLLLAQICEGATGYKEIKDRQAWPVVSQWLPRHQAGVLEHLVPERIALSNGREVRVSYSEGQAPKLPVPIQFIFGLRDAPAVCEGRVRVLFEILAPNQRPVQVTEDLAGFWSGSYRDVRAQLRGRYPKHAWPEF